jgi:glucose dehydrogenase
MLWERLAVSIGKLRIDNASQDSEWRARCSNITPLFLLAVGKMLVLGKARVVAIGRSAYPSRSPLMIGVSNPGGVVVMRGGLTLVAATRDRYLRSCET